MSETFDVGVAAAVVTDTGILLVQEAKGTYAGCWGLPKGHVEPNESIENAVLRELEEETSIKNVELITEIDEITTYELPNHLLGKIWKGKFKGQKQKWFLMRHLGSDDEININTSKPEFFEWKWIELNSITEIVVNFKLNVYKILQKKLEKIIN